MVLNDNLKMQAILFIDFIKIFMKKQNSKILDIEEDKNDLEDFLSLFSREERKVLQKNNRNYIIKDNRDEIYKYINFLSDILNYLTQDNYKINCNFDFANLIYFLGIFRKYEKKFPNLKLKEEEKNRLNQYIIGEFVIYSKENNEKNLFIDCFDDNGKIIIEKASTLNLLLKEFYKKLTTSYIGYEIPLQQEEFIDIVISKEQLEKAYKLYDEIRKKKQEEAEKLRLEQQEKNRLEKLKSKSIEVKSPIIKKIKNNNPEWKLFEKYVYPSYELKPNIIDKVTLDKFIEDLSKISFLTKNDINTFVEKFNKMKFDKRCFKLLRIVDKNDLKKLKKVITDDFYYSNDNIALKSFILSDSFDKLNDKEIKNTIKSLLQKNNENSNTNFQNLIVLANKNLIDSELNNIMNARISENKEDIIKSIYYHLKKLQTNTIDELRCNISDAFHEFKTGSSEPYIIEDKLKAYRFGQKKVKIGLFSLSVHKDNQKKLQEMFNTKFNSNIFLIFGMSSIFVEEENSLYERMRKNAEANKKQLLEIYDIFANKFTNETFKKACALINNGIIQINNLEKKEKELDLEN